MFRVKNPFFRVSCNSKKFFQEKYLNFLLKESFPVWWIENVIHFERFLSDVSFTLTALLLCTCNKKNSSSHPNTSHKRIVQTFIDSLISVQWHVYHEACVVDRIQKYYCSSTIHQGIKPSLLNHIDRWFDSIDFRYMTSSYRGFTWISVNARKDL